MADIQAEELISRINSDMRQAMKSRDKLKLDELRSLIARLNSAEAVKPVQQAGVGSTTAGAGLGVGSTEVERKQLTLDDVQNVIRVEIDEINQVLANLNADSDYAEQLSAKIAVINIYLEQK